MLRNARILLPLILALAGCARNETAVGDTSCGYASYFDIICAEDGNPSAVVVISPYDSHRDTLHVDASLDNIICMSSSHVAALASVGADTVISAVSGIRYISDPKLRSRYPESLHDIGYENSLDYETIVSLKPDLLVTYTITGAEPPYVTKLKSLGIPVLVLHDHLEEHPLARAEYVRLFGAMTGRHAFADSLFNTVRSRYDSLATKAERDPERRVKVLMNIPYGDAWYIPGADSYMSRLVSDAGGVVLGSAEGMAVSRVVKMEEAYVLSQKAECWLNPGHCRTRNELSRIHQLFPSFGPLSGNRPIYNNTLRTTPEGGNDFWESGAMRPDLILEDLIAIFSGEDADGDLNYFFRLD